MEKISGLIILPAHFVLLSGIPKKGKEGREKEMGEGLRKEGEREGERKRGVEREKYRLVA